MSRGKPEASEAVPDGVSASRFVRITAVLTGVALAVRLWDLTSVSFWIDETFQSFVVHGSWHFFIRSLAQDAVHPPLDYLADRFVAAFGVAPLDLRVLPAIWGTLTVPALGLLVRRRAGEIEAACSMGVLAVGPVWVGVSQEIRPYALGLLSLTAAMLLIDRALERPTSGRIAAFSIASAAVVFTLYIAAVQLVVATTLLLAEDFTAGDSGRRRNALRIVRRLPILTMAVAAAFVPWLLYVAGSHIPRFRAAARHPFGPAALARTLSRYSFSYKEGGFSFGPPRLFQAMVGVFALLAIAGFLDLVRRRGTRWLAFWMPAGTLVLVAAERATPFYLSSRYLLAAWLVFPVLIGMGLARFWRWRAAAGAALLTAVMAVEFIAVAASRPDRRYDWTRLAGILSRSPVSEIIYCDGTDSLYPVAHALCGPRWLEDHACARTIVDLAEQPDAIDCRDRSKRAWLVLSGRATGGSLDRLFGAEPRISFPEAEGSALRRLRPERRVSAPVPAGFPSARELR